MKVVDGTPEIGEIAIGLQIGASGDMQKCSTKGVPDDVLCEASSRNSALHDLRVVLRGPSFRRFSRNFFELKSQAGIAIVALGQVALENLPLQLRKPRGYLTSSDGSRSVKFSLRNSSTASKAPSVTEIELVVEIPRDVDSPIRCHDPGPGVAFRIDKSLVPVSYGSKDLVGTYSTRDRMDPPRTLKTNMWAKVDAPDCEAVLRLTIGLKVAVPLPPNTETDFRIDLPRQFRVRANQSLNRGAVASRGSKRFTRSFRDGHLGIERIRDARLTLRVVDAEQTDLSAHVEF